MGAASADVPAIMLTGGPVEAAWFRGRELGAGTDLWHYADELRAGRMTPEEFDELEAAATPGVGHCNEMGTASTMASLVEALGMCAAGHGHDPGRRRRARCARPRRPARRAVELAREGLAPGRDRHGGGVRQRDHAADGDRRRDERGRPPARARRPRRRRRSRSTVSTSSRGARRCSPTCGPSGEHLFEHLAPRGRHTGACCTSSRRCCTRGPDRHRQTLGEETRRRRPRPDVIATLAEPLAGEGGLGRPARLARAARRGASS